MKKLARGFGRERDSAAEQEEIERQQDAEEDEADGGIEEEISFRVAGIADRVFAERDEAREGGDERPDAADIHADEKLAPVVREIRKQDRRGDVADELAREGGEEHDVSVEQRAEGVPHDVEPRRIPREDEEEYEREEKRVVDGGNGVTVQNEQGRGDDQKPDGIGDRPEDHQDGHEEEDGVEDAAGFIETDFKAV